jgi:adenosine deaminase
MTGGRDLATLPKAHLHLHLEGAMRPGTLRDLAAANHMAVPPIRGFADFGAFVGMYRAACAVLVSETELRRLVREVVEDAAADGVTWVEPAFYPPNHRDRLGPDEATTEIVCDELTVSGRRLGVGTGLVVAADRTTPPDEAVGLARMAARMAKRGLPVVGFGLANDEAGYPPEPFAAAFAIAREAGLLAVPHGGELDGPASVRGCLDACGAHRVMHGVRAIEDPRLVARLADEGICLDVCPSSNVALGVVARMEDHPLPQLLAAGVPCSLNADDPLLFGPGILSEYQLCRETLGLDDRALATIAAASMAASGAPEELRKSALAAIEVWRCN